MEKNEKTYLEAINVVIADLDKVYDKAGGLRDYADGQLEKGAWNNLRGALQRCFQEMYQLRNSLPDDRADLPIESDGYFK